MSRIHEALKKAEEERAANLGNPVQSSVAATPVSDAPAFVETAAMPSTSVPPASASLGEIWLAEDSRAQYRSCNTHHGL